MNYIGSKLSLLDFLEASIDEVTGKNGTTFCDLFAGTGAVGSRFKRKGYKIIANDIQYYSYVLNKHYIGNHKELVFEQLTKELPFLEKADIENRKNFVCQYLSDLEGVAGFIYNNYSYGGTKDSVYPRQYFSDDNAMRSDAMRIKIEDWKNRGLISEDEYYFLIASLLESVDKCANTASVYGAFLKKLKKTAQNNLVLKPAALGINEQEHEVFNEDVNELIEKVSGDILYLDPPYNHRQYATNYHLLETLAKYDNPIIYGKTGLRDYGRQKSLYCSGKQVRKVFEKLIRKARARYIFLSYNNEGLISLDEVGAIMRLRGKYGCFTKEYTRFKADTSANRHFKAPTTTEYLHYVICEKSGLE